MTMINLVKSEQILLSTSISNNEMRLLLKGDTERRSHIFDGGSSKDHAIFSEVNEPPDGLERRIELGAVENAS
jgi:hypothetical protein